MKPDATWRGEALGKREKGVVLRPQQVSLPHDEPDTKRLATNGLGRRETRERFHQSGDDCSVTPSRQLEELLSGIAALGERHAQPGSLQVLPHLAQRRRKVCRDHDDRILADALTDGLANPVEFRGGRQPDLVIQQHDRGLATEPAEEPHDSILPLSPKRQPGSLRPYLARQANSAGLFLNTTMPSGSTVMLIDAGRTQAVASTSAQVDAVSSRSVIRRRRSASLMLLTAFCVVSSAAPKRRRPCRRMVFCNSSMRPSSRIS